MAQARASSGAKKEVDELEKHIRRQSKGQYHLVPSGGGHKKVVDKSGHSVRDDNGPLIVSSSPSDVRWRAMTVKRLMNAKVLLFDPWNPSERVEAENGKVSKSVQVEAERRRDQLRLSENNQRQARQTMQVRSWLEPFIVRLGGWDRRGVAQDFATVLYEHARKHRPMQVWPSQEQAFATLANVARGGTLNDYSINCFKALINDLQSTEDPRERYWQLLREAKGLPEPVSGPARQIGPLYDTPTVALEAVMMMTAGIHNLADPDLDRIAATGQRILRLELLELQRGTT